MFPIEKIKFKKSYWLIILLAGVLLMIISLPTTNKKETKESTTSMSADTVSDNAYEQSIQNKLEMILKQIEGVGKVSVMITFADNGQTQVEKDEATQTDLQENKEDGTSSLQKNTSISQQTIYSEEQPFVTSKVNPTIEGILIVAEGGENTSVKKNISEAVEALFGLEAHKIKIVKMTQ